MARYRNKPVVVEAVQFGTNGKFVGAAPGWVNEAALAGKIVRDTNVLLIQTLDGEMRCELGDWLILGSKGEIYPCKVDVFEATYELVV